MRRHGIINYGQMQCKKKPNLTPSLRHTIMSNLITVFLAACPRAHDLKKPRLIDPRKKQHYYYFQAFYLIRLPGGSKVKMVESLFQSLHIPYIMRGLSFSTCIQLCLIYPMYVLIPFPYFFMLHPCVSSSPSTSLLPKLNMSKLFKL